MKMKSILIALAILSLTVQAINFCEVESPELAVFTTQKQIQQIPLNKHVRGYNLDFSSTDQTTVSIFQPYHVADKSQVTIKAGYVVVNADGKNSNTKLWSRQGILFAQGGEKNISIGYGQFASGVLPKIQNYSYYELPYASNCYSGLIYNQNMDVVVDCQRTTAIKEQMSDLICLVTKAGKLNCKDIPSITKTSKRKNIIFELQGQKFLISASLTDHISSEFRNQTFLTIYHIVDQSIDFNLIVDRHTLGLDFLAITDVDLLQFNGEDYIVLTDANSRLVAFKYTLANSVKDIMIIPVQSIPRQFAQSADGTWLIAVQKYIIECNYVKSSKSVDVIRRYQLDPSDNQVTDLQSSSIFVTVRTFLGNLYTYDRKYTQLKYLLNKQQINQHTVYVVSPFYPRIFQINSTMMASISISSGYLFISQVQQTRNVIITAHSGNTSCVFNVRIQFVADGSKIYQKKRMTSAYRLQSSETVKFTLSDYFGGSNLKYNVTSSQDIKFNLQHINSYKQNLPNLSSNDKQVLFSVLVDVDEKNYWIAQFSTDAARFYKCQVQGSQISCVENEKEKFDPKNRTFAFADGYQRKDGQASVSWTFKESNSMYIKKLGSTGFTYIISNPITRFSQVVVSQKYNIFVQKQLNRISFYNGVYLNIFTKNSFTQAQLNEMGGGFYPREISLSHKNDHIFYLKFPISIVTIFYQGGKEIEVLSVNKISDTYIPDDLWSIVVGRQSLLLFTPEQVAQYAVLADSSIAKLHKLILDRQPIYPIRYETTTDTAYFECEDGTIQYIRLNQPAIDSQYYNVELKKQNGRRDWDVSGSWLVTMTGQAYFQYVQPALIITSTVPDSTYKQDLTISITVASENQKKEVVANVTAYNYPVKIEASSQQDNGIVLPEKGDDTIVPIPIDKYFTGSVANYRIVCPYCLDGTIELLPPIRKINENTDLSNFQGVVGLEDNMGSIVLKENSIYIIGLNNQVVFKKQIQTTGECLSLGTNEANLVVFCGSSSNQQILLFSVTDKQLTLVNTYFVPAQALLIKPSQINLYRKGNSNKVTVFIHDVDLMSPGSKDSNIKVFQLSQAIIYKGTIDTSTFKLPNSEPINSMAIHLNHMLVTIGGKGLGFIDLSDYSTGQFISLEDEPSLKNFTLDNTEYLRVTIYKNNQQKQDIKALVTTSNTFNYFIQLKISGTGEVSFYKILETYKRYGHQKCLNWGLINEKFAMIAFYNSSTSVETLALYKRSGQGLVDFFTSLQFTVPAPSLKIPKAALLHQQTGSESSSLLYLNNVEKPASTSSLNLYNITEEFSLLLKYQKPSSFDIIQVTASNDYYSVSRDLKVEFEGNNTGIKWYSIVIAVILVAIAIGVALGFYLKMKKKKADSKKVSLFTENEEIDEQV